MTLPICEIYFRATNQGIPSTASLWLNILIRVACLQEVLNPI